MASDALTLRDVDAFYGDSHVLHGVSFVFGEGRLVGLLGRNGAGKTTSINVVMGQLRPRRGSVAVWALRSPAVRPRRSRSKASPWCRRAGASSAA